MANGKENAMDADAPSKSLWSRRISRILIGVIAVLVVLIGMSFVAYEIANQVRHKFQPAQETIGLDAVLPPQDTFDFTEEFRVNTANSEGSHFIRTKISLAYHTQSEELAIELEKRNSQMRNIVNLILMSKTKEELASVESRIYLQEEIRASINHVLIEGKITDIYFTQFLLN